jgi:hopanoid biosynthesis associated RND transporter like protein HpnN
MLNSALARLVDWSFRHAVAVIAVAVIVAATSCAYAVRHFAINTDVNSLISSKLPWRQRELAYEAAFPQSIQSILAVVQSPTPELASAAQRALAAELAKSAQWFQSTLPLGGGDFFEQNSLLYLPLGDLRETTDKLKNAAPLVRALAEDPSLRGLTGGLSMALAGIQAQRYSLDQMSPSFDAVSDTLENVLAGRSASFSWKVLLNGRPPSPDDLRRLIEIWAKLDFSSLQPGQRASSAIRAAADRAALQSDLHSQLRLTGPVPMADAEFATLREGALTNGLISAAIVIVILWLALGSLRLVLAVAATLTAGLAVAAALGLAMVGALNPISVAFAVLFVGLGADFAIQFSVRFRAKRHELGDLHKALFTGAQWIAAPLLLAALSAAAGFFSFMPTDYRGLAELGLISGCGMIVAYIACVTVLPAMIGLVKPPPEPRPLEYSAMAPLDSFLARHRIPVVVGTVGIAILGSPFLLHLQFDFNPLHLRNPNEEAVATYLELSKDPAVAANPAEVLTQSPEAAAAVAKKLGALPQVAQTRTIDSFVPDDQDQKLGLIGAAATALDPALNPTNPRSAPSDAENVAALEDGARRLIAVAGSGAGAAAAKRLADDMTRLAGATPDLRTAAQTAFVQPLTWDFDELRHALHPQHVTRANLPPALIRDWIAPDGQSRAEAVPKGDQNDNDNLQRFADAVLQAEPSATGPAIGISEWARTIVYAFVEAGAFALAAIGLLLWIALRRAGDMLLTLIPLLVAGVATLEICGLTRFPLNYANIMALPVLLGVGVAFKIYYVTAWRAGETHFLQSVLTRAVVFSALMTATAFGSLWLSSNPGISSMGKLLVLSLGCTLVSAALFQPALMGAPREVKQS